MSIQMKNDYSKASFIKRILYSFDATGFAKVPGFLSEDQVDSLNEKIDTALEPYATEHGFMPTKFSFFDLDPLFFDVLTNQLVLDICAWTAGEWFRLDHTIGLNQPGKMVLDDGSTYAQDDRFGNLHGAPFASQYSCFYQKMNGRPLVGQFVVGIVLSPQYPDDGGFCYIPGSHHTCDHRTGDRVLSETLESSFRDDLIEVPELQKGDLVFFTEATVHGMAPWKPKDRYRRNVYYKISPGFLSWASYDLVSPFLDLAKTDLQKKILRPAFVSEFSADRITTDNVFREKTHQPSINILKEDVSGREAVEVIKNRISTKLGSLTKK